MKGLLILKLIAARNLQPMDSNGFSDPYFVFSVGNQKAKSETKYKNLSPSYEETFNFILNGEDVLHLEGYDADLLLHDDYLGRCDIDLKKLKHYEPVIGWLKLQEARTGEVNLCLTFISLESSDSEQRDLFGFCLDTNDNAPDSKPSLLINPKLVQPKDVHGMSASDLSSKGIPFAHKAEMWMVYSGAKQKKHLNPELYKNLLQCKFKDEILDEIQKDLARTFPGHPFFADNSNGVAALKRILLAYSLNNPRLGYCQSMNVVAGFLLLFMEEEDAFWMLATVVDNILSKYYDSDMAGLQIDTKVFEYYVKHYFPDISRHFEEVGAHVVMCCMQWFLCIFIDIFPTETTLRLCDALFCHGRDILLQSSLNLLRANKQAILSSKRSSDIYELMKGLPSKTVDWQQFFKDAQSHFSPLEDVEKVRAKFAKEVSDSMKSIENQRIQRNTHLSIDEIEELRCEMEEFSHANSLSQSNFQKLLERKFGKKMIFAEQLFKAFDKSGDGTVDFQELSKGLSVFTKGNLEEKLRLCFSLFDANKDGFIQQEEFMDILETQYKVMFPGDNQAYVKSWVEFFFEFDTNNDGKFSFEEFTEAVRKQPLIVQFFHLDN